MSTKSNQLLARKVIHLIPHDGVGGVEVAARSMLKSDSLNGNFKLLLIAGKTLNEDRENVVESPFRSANNPLAYFRAISEIYKKPPEVLVCSLWRSVSVGVAVKIMRPKTKLVFFLHLASTVHGADTFLHKLMLRYCDAIWADSQITLNARVSDNSSYPTSVISFVTQKPEHPQLNKPPSPKFVFWGRLHKQKGVDRAIRLIKELVVEGQDCSLQVWGRDDGEKEHLVNLVDALKLTNHVEFKGPADNADLQSIAKQHCFYLQLSRTEGMAMSVLEAMQFGLIPVVTPVGEIKNYCVNGENSVVVHETDTFSETVASLTSILGDERSFNVLQKNAFDTWKEAALYEDDFIRAANRLCLKH